MESLSMGKIISFKKKKRERENKRFSEFRDLTLPSAFQKLPFEYNLFHKIVCFFNKTLRFSSTNGLQSTHGEKL